MIDKDMTELLPFKVRRVSYSSVSCIRDQRVLDVPISINIGISLQHIIFSLKQQQHNQSLLISLQKMCQHPAQIGGSVLHQSM